MIPVDDTPAGCNHCMVCLKRGAYLSFQVQESFVSDPADRLFEPAAFMLLNQQVSIQVIIAQRFRKYDPECRLPRSR